jgi:hypothetical protein
MDPLAMRAGSWDSLLPKIEPTFPSYIRWKGPLLTESNPLIGIVDLPQLVHREYIRRYNIDP